MGPVRLVGRDRRAEPGSDLPDPQRDPQCGCLVGYATARASTEVAEDGQSFAGTYTIEPPAAMAEGPWGIPVGQLGPGDVTGQRIVVEPMGEPVKAGSFVSVMKGERYGISDGPWAGRRTAGPLRSGASRTGGFTSYSSTMTSSTTITTTTAMSRTAETWTGPAVARTPWAVHHTGSCRRTGNQPRSTSQGMRTAPLTRPKR